MKKLMNYLAAIMLMTTMFISVGCNPEKEVKVTTGTPCDITLTTAVCGGTVVSSQGTEFVELGVCWDTVANPNASNAHLFTVNWEGTVSSGRSFSCAITGLKPYTKYHVRAYAYTGSEYYYGEDRSFITDDGTGGGGGGNGGGETPPTPGPEPGIDTLFVDLGLPSGLLWAKYNIGAKAPEECGDYFSWGETVPKSYYGESTYKYYNGTSFTKYSSSDGLTILLPEDDAALVNWGGKARLPKTKEWDELVDKCEVVWTSLNGMSGLWFTGPNGNNLFLPAAGYRVDDIFGSLGYSAYYYSDSLYTSLEDCAGCLYFDHEGWGTGNAFRFFGNPIRPVLPAR